MKRRGIGRTPGLTVRMVCALILLALTYAAVGVGVYELFRVFRGGWPYWILVTLALAVAVTGHYRAADKTLLASIGAEPVKHGTQPELEQMLHRLSSLAQIPLPRLAISDTAAANAFAVGLSQRGAVVVVTRGLTEKVSGTELEAVLAHEVAHIVNRDAAVLTAVAAPRILGEVMVGGTESDWLNVVWLLIWPLGLPIYAIGALLTLTVSRYREFSADWGSAVLTGAPQQLMSALQKLSFQASEIPHDDLRAANAFCIVPTEASVISLFSDHPPLEKRLAALAEIAREMGKPVS